MFERCAKCGKMSTIFATKLRYSIAFLDETDTLSRSYNGAVKLILGKIEGRKVCLHCFFEGRRAEDNLFFGFVLGWHARENEKFSVLLQHR